MNIINLHEYDKLSEKEEILSINSFSSKVNHLAYDFYNAVIKNNGSFGDVGVLLIACGYETSLPMIQSMRHNGINFCGIIIKESSGIKNLICRQKLKETKFPILDITKKDLRESSDKTLNLISNVVAKYKKIVILDHGGYFALNPRVLNIFGKNRLIGIAEFTLNGEMRYRSLNKLNVPVFSIAQSPLKKISDEATSESIIIVANFHARKGGVILSESINQIGIIGRGRLGKKISQDLIQINPYNVLVYDYDLTKLDFFKSTNISFDKKNLLSKCNIVFCATGNKALAEKDFEYLQNNTILFTVTSPDDELDLEGLVSKGILKFLPQKSLGDNYTYRVIKTGKNIILPFSGESPNTVLEYGEASSVIHQPAAAHILCGLRLVQAAYKRKPEIIPISKCDQQIILKIWNKFYK